MKYRNLLLRPVVFPPVEQSRIEKLAPANCSFPPHPPTSVPALPLMPTLIVSAIQTPLSLLTLPTSCPNSNSLFSTQLGQLFHLKIGKKYGRVGQGSSKHDNAEGALQCMCVIVKQLPPKKKWAGKWTKDEVFSTVTFLVDHTVLD